MEDYQKRVVQEGEELKTKMEALGKFILTEKFDELDAYDQDLLKTQLRAMIQYLNVLTARIERFKK
tara:strand:+ start:24478 stop:24675 length:198 start_codon:yes stop_codon:yes gene_type:complete